MTEQLNSGKLAIVIIGDLHINSTVGLCQPVVNLDDGGTYRASKGQRWLWYNWCNFLDQVSEKGYNSDIYIVSMGDLVDGDHHSTTQIITRNLDTQRKMAAGVLDPLMQMASKRFFIRGTPVHAGAAGCNEESIAEDFGGEQDGHNYSWWHLITEFGKVKFDFGHFSTAGALPWTEKNAANKVASLVMNDYATRGEKLPNYAFRAHNHLISDSGLNYPVRAMLTPAWQLKTEYVYSRRAVPRVADIGGIIVTIDAGTHNLSLIEYEPERRRVWKG